MTMRPDQLQPGEHVKDMGGGWVVLSADFICAMVWPYGQPVKVAPKKPRKKK